MRLLQRRKQQIDREAEIREVAQLHGEMQQHFASLVALDDTLATQLRDAAITRAVLQEGRQVVQISTDLVLRLKQGQLELPPAPVVCDMSDAVMVPIAAVISLNEEIVGQASSSVQSLKEMAVFKRGIRDLQWYEGVEQQ